MRPVAYTGNTRVFLPGKLAENVAGRGQGLQGVLPVLAGSRTKTLGGVLGERQERRRVGGARMMQTMSGVDLYDVAVVGSGPAGLAPSPFFGAFDTSQRAWPQGLHVRPRNGSRMDPKLRCVD